MLRIEEGGIRKRNQFIVWVSVFGRLTFWANANAFKCNIWHFILEHRHSWIIIIFRIICTYFHLYFVLTAVSASGSNDVQCYSVCLPNILPPSKIFYTFIDSFFTLKGKMRFENLYMDHEYVCALRISPPPPQNTTYWKQWVKHLFIDILYISYVCNIFTTMSYQCVNKSKYMYVSICQFIHHLQHLLHKNHH